MPRRSKPYTPLGIRRVPCVKCGKPSQHQWRLDACADGNRVTWLGLCAKHDVQLNTLILRWFFGRGKEAQIARYRSEKLG